MNQDIKEIELDIERAREFIKLQEAADRLRNNKDFQKVILEDYFKNEAVRLVEALSAPGLQEEKYQKAIIKALEGIGQLKQYFNKVHHQAVMSQTAIEEGQAAIDELLDSENNPGSEGVH